RDVLEPGRPEVEAVYARFGAGIRLADGSLDRTALGRLVFSDVDALKDLEAIVHPAVRPRILAVLAAADAAAARAVVIEAIKLVESGLAELCDEVWLVTCDPAVQLDRVVGRGLSPEDARQRIEAQNDPARRLRPHATRVIETSASLAATRSQLARALTEALRDPS
ncbi:MAG: dephospho-CoA kinase, partial [Chloroflexi bacterium]|nr:dephospho-CoA kinase [Chloroflexota bacterium]